MSELVQVQKVTILALGGLLVMRTHKFPIGQEDPKPIDKLPIAKIILIPAHPLNKLSGPITKDMFLS